MAFYKPKFYPVLPRERRVKLAPNRVRGNLLRVPVYTPKLRKADYLDKTFNTYLPNWISEDTKEFQGNDEKAGTKNPGWKVTIAKGGDATSSYSRTIFKVRPTAYSIRSENPTSLSVGYGTAFGGLLIQQNAYTDLEDQAIGRLKNRLSGKVGNAQLGPPLAESREIGRLVRQINGLGMETFKALLAAKKSKGKSVFKQFGQIWLGFGFGVNPLLQDIKAATDSILHYVTRMDRRIVIRGAATREYTSGLNSVTSSSDSISAHCTLGWYLSAHHTQGVQYTAGIDLQVRAGSNYSMPDHLGLKVEALPSILWELTPFSWVVDYGTTVGSFLDDVFYTLPGTVKYLSKSYKYQCRTYGSPKAINIPGAKSVLGGSISYGEYIQFTREKLAATLPTRSLRIKTADEVASHGVTKLLNLASVLAGRRGPNLAEKTGHQFREKVNPL